MERIDKYINHYQKLDQYLQRNNGKTRDLSFSRRIDEFVQDHPGYRQKAPKLKDYGDLRNAMIHQRDPKGGWIAEPSEAALQDFEQIVQSIVDPPKLIPKFQKDVRIFSPQEPLSDALRHMRGQDYSQIVIRSGENLSLLTVEGIAQWLEEQALKEVISVQEATIADALKYEQKEPVSIANRNQTIYDVVEFFTPSIAQKKPRIYALIITTNGKATEKPLGIITPWDLLSIVNL